MTPIPDLYHLAFEGTDIGLVLCNAERRCVVANAASATLLGSEAASLPGSAMETLLGPQSPGMPEWELRREHPDGGVVWLLCRISPPLVGSGHFVVTLLDISERKRYVEELQHCATRDPVTGLPGRTPFCERLAQAIAYAVRNRQPLAVLLLDIDQFQRISAEFGNTASDSLRRTLAERLHTAVRQEDTLAALGTDQYALLLQPTSSESVAAAAQRLLELLAAPVRVGELEFVLSACVGVALHPEDGDSAEDLLDRATEAMLEAKRQGPGHIQFINAEINVKAKRRLAIG
ncbi:MAG: diguanylate cyclase, partial [Pseudomonadota bacterium]